MKTIAAVMLAGAFLLSPPVFAKAKAKTDKTAEKKDEAKKDDGAAAAPKAEEPKKDDKKAEKGW